MFNNKKIKQLEAEVAELKAKVAALAETVAVFCMNVDALAESCAVLRPREESQENGAAPNPKKRKDRPRKKSTEETAKTEAPSNMNQEPKKKRRPNFKPKNNGKEDNEAAE